MIKKDVTYGDWRIVRHDDTLRFQVTNAFGETEQVSHSCKITYDDQVPDLKSWVLYIANPANLIDTAEAWYKYDDLSNGRFLKEGTSLAYEVAIDDYYGIKNVEVLISTDGQATWKTCGSFSEFSGTDNDGAIYKTYKSEAKSACFIEYLGDLDVLNNTGYFKLKITNATGKTTTIESIQSFDYYAHNIPFISIKESKCTKENLTFTDIVDSGATTTESKNSVTKVERFYSLDDGKNFVPYNNPSDDRFGSIKVTHTEKITKEFVYVKLKVKTTQTLTLATNDIISTTREFVTDSIIVYNLVPTLAWRKNWIGINTEDYDSDNGKQSVLTVQGYDTRNRVLFKTGNATSYIELDPRGAGGAELINFIIDCGTWD